MIIETLVTTDDGQGRMNVAPMGAVVDGTEFDFFELRPFRTATTFENLSNHGQGVLHVTDDSRLIVLSALELPLPELAVLNAQSVHGHILADCCRCYEFVVKHSDTTSDRTSFSCQVKQVHRFREFVGFNRAKHAIIEAAILATRIEFIPGEEILDQLRRFSLIVQKTGGPVELESFQTIDAYINERIDSATSIS